MSTTVRSNERSWAISMISDINIVLQSLNLRIARAGGEATISTGHQSMFPDVLLYSDVAQTQILQGWELKLPDTSITDITFIEDAQRKANQLGLNSCFIWNFNCGVLYVKGNNGEFHIEKQWNETNHIRTRSDVERYRSDWFDAIKKILLEINEYLLVGAIHGSALGEIISDSIIATIIERNKINESTELQKSAVSNTVLEAYIDEWWNETQEEFVVDETNKFDAYAKLVLLNWTNRIIFAHLIKLSHNAAIEVNNLNFDTTPSSANTVFERITSNCDFYSIFSGMEYNTILPACTWHDLMDLNLFLTTNGLNQIQQESLQSILERTVAVSKREINGQFTTPSILADLLVRLTVRDWNGNIIDPCCGTGSIAKAVLDNKKRQSQNIQKSVETTWASDKFSFPLQITNISLTGVDSINIPNRIFKHNVFSLNQGEEILIVNPSDGQRMSVDLPIFKAIVSNLPFVPFEKINEVDLQYIKQITQDVFSSTGVLLNGRSDYYSFIIFALHKLLENNGHLGVITSNSWLGTTAGHEFFCALGHYFKIEQIHISNTTRWFSNAKVITAITILTKREEISEPKNDENTIFCLWNKSLSELAASEQFRKRLVNSCLLKREVDKNIIKLKPYNYAQIRKLQEMKVSLSALFHDISWLLKIKDKLVQINKVFRVVRGERRGWDPMFYPAAGHSIEEQYIKKVLKNARAVNFLTVKPDSDAFCCSLSLEALETSNHQGAISWINRFQNGVNKVGEPLTQSLYRPNMYWYEMKDNNVADIVTTMNPDRRLFFAKFEQPSFINQRLIGFKKNAEYPDLELNHALLNSLLGMFYVEAVGFGRGMGALDISGKTIKNAYMLNPHLISPDQRGKILEKFTPLLRRKVYDTEREMQEEDRAVFDHEVLIAFGIDEYYDIIKNSILSMQKMRLNVR